MPYAVCGIFWMMTEMGGESVKSEEAKGVPGGTVSIVMAGSRSQFGEIKGSHEHISSHNEQEKDRDAFSGILFCADRIKTQFFSKGW